MELEMMQPEEMKKYQALLMANVHILPVLAGVVANMVLGFLWYGPLFGKKWAGYIGIDFEKKPGGKQMAVMMVVQLIGAFLLSWCLANNIAAWMPSSWGILKTQPMPVIGMMSAFFTWLGFFVPSLLAAPTWEGKPWGLFFINAGYWLVSLIILGQIIANWR